MSHDEELKGPETDPWDAIPEDPHRAGRHRAEPYRPAAGYRKLVALGAAALVVGLLCAGLLPLLGFMPKESAVQSVASSSASQESVTATSSSTGTADPALRKRTVSIYDATGESGKLQEMASKVSGKGWVVGELNTWPSEAPARTTVYYGNENLKKAAELLSADLDGVEVAQDKTLKDSLRLVISPGYAAG